MKYFTTLLFALALSGCGNSGSSSTAAVSASAKATADTDTQVTYLGTQKAPDGKILEGFMFKHPRKIPTHKPNHPGNPGGGGGKTSTCYAFIAGSAIKWKVAENYLVDPTNSSGLDHSWVVSKVQEAIFSWDNQVGPAIFGPEVLGTIDRASIGNSANGQTEWVFDTIDDPGVIAYTVVWGIFSGPPRNRELREWDMVFDDVDFDWGDAGPTNENALGNTEVMDFLNILVHEFGHAAGMGHPGDTCTEETMFRYATEGETKKRTLFAGDIAGIKKLYK